MSTSQVEGLEVRHWGLKAMSVNLRDSWLRVEGFTLIEDLRRLINHQELSVDPLD